MALPVNDGGGDQDGHQAHHQSAAFEQVTQSGYDPGRTLPIHDAECRPTAYERRRTKGRTRCLGPTLRRGLLMMRFALARDAGGGVGRGERIGECSTERSVEHSAGDGGGGDAGRRRRGWSGEERARSAPRLWNRARWWRMSRAVGASAPGSSTPGARRCSGRRRRSPRRRRRPTSCRCSWLHRNPRRVYQPARRLPG